MYFALLPVGGSLLFSTLLYIFAFVFVCSVRQFGSRSQSRCCPSSCPLPLHPDPCSDGVDNDVVGDDGPAGGTESPGGACHPHWQPLIALFREWVSSVHSLDNN